MLAKIVIHKLKSVFAATRVAHHAHVLSSMANTSGLANIWGWQIPKVFHEISITFFRRINTYFLRSADEIAFASIGLLEVRKVTQDLTGDME